MKRDLQLYKKILLKIEEEYINTPIFNLEIEGYELNMVANHIELLFNEGLISQYKPQYASDELLFFSVGNLTNEGFNYLDEIRNVENLEPYKHINIYLDNSIKIGDKNKIKYSDLVTGDKNGKK